MRVIYFDVDTQNDFVLPSGALSVPGAELALPKIAALNHHAARSGSIVISTTDAHAEDDPEFRDWPPHCVAGTLGQRKPDSTLLARRSTVPAVSSPLPSLTGVEQVIVEKVALDCFTNPNLPALLAALEADCYRVYGVVTEICVQYAAMGLLQRGKRVELVNDAVRSLSFEKEQAFFSTFETRGGVLVSSLQVFAK